MDAVLDRFDSARREVWRVAAKTSLGRRCATDRATRLSVLGITHTLTLLALVALAPVWLLLVGPLVLGVPHVMADIRYCFIRPARPIGWLPRVVVALPILGLMGMRAANLFFGVEIPLWNDVAFGSAAIVLASALGPRSAGARVGLTLITVGLGVLALAHARTTILIFAHAHNVIALGIFALWARSRGVGSAAFAVVPAFVIAIGLIAVGALEPVTAYFGGTQEPVAGLSLAGLAASLAPGVDGALATRIVLVYAFAQAMHYVLWLRLTPGAVLPGPPSLTYRRTLRGWVEDFGRLPFALAALSIIAVPIWAAFAEPMTVRSGYLSLAGFHGWLELAMLAMLGLGRARPASN